MKSAAIIDMHVHLFPPGMFEAVWNYFESYDWRVHRQHVEQVAQTLADHGVAMATALSYPHKKGVARPLNEFMESVGAEYEIFKPFASVHVEDDDLRECIDHALESPHIHGFKFQPLVQHFDINDPRLDALYIPSMDRQFPIIMHIGTAPYANEFVGLKFFRRLMKRYPTLRVCVAHMGGFEFDGFLEMLGDCPNMFLDTTMINVKTELFDASWRGDDKMLKRHARRICFGSDWPNVPYPYQEALDSIERFGLPPDALPGVRGGNARRFLKPGS